MRTGRPRSIAINGRFLTQPVSGVQRYAREIVKALDKIVAQSPQWRGPVRLLAPPGSVCDLDLKAIQFQQIGRGGGHLWEQLFLPWCARGDHLISLGNSGPVTHRRHTVVIHDAAPYRFPELFSRTYGAVHRTLGRILSRTARLASVSQFSRGELAAIFHLPIEKIAVFSNGYEHLQAVSAETAVLARLGIAPKGYFLTVGNLTPNKNLALVIEALKAFEQPDFKLVLVGRADESIFGGAAFDLSQVVILAGRLSDEEVKALYLNATALIFPSRYEGFGIPPLEAFASQCPVLASSIPAVEEVCGDAALYFDPDDAPALAGHMATVMSPGFDLAAFQANGQTRLRAYSWHASADALLKEVGRGIQ